MLYLFYKAIEKFLLFEHKLKTVTFSALSKMSFALFKPSSNFFTKAFLLFFSLSKMTLNYFTFFTQQLSFLETVNFTGVDLNT